MIPQIDAISATELIQIYFQILTQLKERKIIRTKNLVGDLGEYLVIEHYNQSPQLPNLKLAPPATQSIDAISEEGKRYAIKSTSSNLTGVFYGLNPPHSNDTENQLFDYVIVAKFGEKFNLIQILELTWEQFLEFKRWHSTMTAWNIPISKKLLTISKIIYDAKSEDIES